MAFFSNDSEMMHGPYQGIAKSFLCVVFLLLFYKFCLAVGIFPRTLPVPPVAYHWWVIDVLTFFSAVFWLLHGAKTHNHNDEWEQALLFGIVLVVVCLVITIGQVIFG
ncbi:MAG: hypothetical protein JWM46_714 [Candidatus Kaiserbacteria bacterium]|nr:hypothetical protein [Candidatus Kaiserbacteria bacterium]